MEGLYNLYNKNGITVRPSLESDIEYLKDRLRQSDIDEIWAASHDLPESALRRSFKESPFCCTILNGNPIGMFGIAPPVVLGNKASIWFLASDDIKKIGRRFAKNSRKFIDTMLSFYGYLYNFVDNRNKDSIKWLKLCGATIEEPKPYGKEQRLFRYFYFKRNS